LEQVVIRLTPSWPHGIEAYRSVYWWMFYAFFLAVTCFRTVCLLTHLWQRQYVFAFLAGTGWDKMIRPGAGRQVLDLLHAYGTGLLCHIFALGPLYLVLWFFDHSLLLMPVRFVCDVSLLGWFSQAGDFNEWLYRDHWVDHNCGFHFVYLHGPHHDALPVSVMAGNDTGIIEGFLRFLCAEPHTYFSPVFSCVFFPAHVVLDMIFHQYVPGVFPYSRMVLRFGHRHVEHHFFNLQPLGSGFENPPGDDQGMSVDFERWIAGYKDSEAWTSFQSRATEVEFPKVK